MKKNKASSWVTSIGLSMFGSLLFAIAVNQILTPLNLYNGGFMGIAQLIRTGLHMAFGISPAFDLAGIIYFMINVPLFVMAWVIVGKTFFWRTVITTGIQTLFLTIVPVASHPIVEETLTNCMIAGIISGVGCGLVLRGGSSGGGQDIIGVCCAKKFPDFSVGKVSIIINVFVYGICAILFNLEIVIYSLIYATIMSVAIDKVHAQNINMTVLIFTKKSGISKEIMTQMGRGVTNWDGTGAYTNETSYILCTVISKYEVNQLKRIVHSVDEHAFMIFTEGTPVSGNFEKRLDA